MIDKPAAGMDAFHRQRSRCIDAFAAVEAQVIKRLKDHGTKCGGEPLAQKIVTLAGTPASPFYPASAKKKTDAVLSSLLELLPVRADIVHAPMVLVVIDGVAHARLINAVAACSPYPSCRLLSFDQFRELTRRLEEIAEQFETAHQK
jgi:hypothetical protein